MSDEPVYRFELRLHTDPKAPKFVALDLTGQQPPIESDLPSAEPPYVFAVDHAAGAHAELQVQALPSQRSDGRVELKDLPFDPNVTSGRSILTVEAFITDHTFTTQDDTRYILRLTNNSRYYVAEDIRVTVCISDTDPARKLPTLPDGNPALALLPGEQHARCVDPGAQHDLVFVAVSRGVRPGLYPIDITLAYRVVYWDGRRTRTTLRQELPVQGRDMEFDLPRTHSPALLPRQPSPTSLHASVHRSKPMSEHFRQPVFFAPVPSPRVRHRILRPIQQRIPLPAGGHLEVAYRLTKSNQPDRETCSCSYGINPESNAVESYFSSQDTAALEVTLHNASPHHLKHVRLSRIRLLTVTEDQMPGVVANQTLPDGNLLFEIIPADIYFGHLAPQETEFKYLSLITRGVAPGMYYVQMDVKYDVEQCTVIVDLPLTVNPD